MKKRNKTYFWKNLAAEFLGDQSLMSCYCTDEAHQFMLELGRFCTGMPEHIYFLTHRDEQHALSELEGLDKYWDVDIPPNNWLRGLRILAAWRLGLPDYVRNGFFGTLFAWPPCGFGDNPAYNCDFISMGGSHYHLLQLKEDQRTALLKQDMAQLRLHVDLAPVPARKLKQLIFLAIREKLMATAAELMNWLTDYPAALDSQTSVLLQKNMLPNESQESFLEKIKNISQYPLMKMLLESDLFRGNWFPWLMSANLLNYEIMKQMLAMGFPIADVISARIRFCRSYGDRGWLEAKRKEEEEKQSYTFHAVMHAFRDLKPFVKQPILNHFTPSKKDKSSELYEKILLYCDLADAYSEWERENHVRK